MKVLLPDGVGYKANLHTHTTESDGKFTPEQVKEYYRAHGYSIVAYTDHLYMRDRSSLNDENFVALNGYENCLHDGGGANADKLNAVRDFALNFGLLFQIYDDILDVISTTKELGKTAGKDAKENKATYVTLFSLEGAKEKFNELNLKCHDILNKEFSSEIFTEILDKMCERVK